MSATTDRDTTAIDTVLREAVAAGQVPASPSPPPTPTA